MVSPATTQFHIMKFDYRFLAPSRFHVPLWVHLLQHNSTSWSLITNFLHLLVYPFWEKRPICYCCFVSLCVSLFRKCSCLVLLPDDLSSMTCHQQACVSRGWWNPNECWKAADGWVRIAARITLNTNASARRACCSMVHSSSKPF
jgi:hypothetical protein